MNINDLEYYSREMRKLNIDHSISIKLFDYAENGDCKETNFLTLNKESIHALEVLLNLIKCKS